MRWNKNSKPGSSEAPTPANFAFSPSELDRPPAMSVFSVVVVVVVLMFVVLMFVIFVLVPV